MRPAQYTAREVRRATRKDKRHSTLRAMCKSARWTYANAGELAEGVVRGRRKHYNAWVCVLEGKRVADRNAMQCNRNEAPALSVAYSLTPPTHSMARCAPYSRVRILRSRGAKRPILHPASCILHSPSCALHHPSSIFSLNYRTNLPRLCSANSKTSHAISTCSNSKSGYAMGVPRRPLSGPSV